jgi:hypothetical protein
MAGLATTMRTHNGQEPTIRPMIGTMAAALIEQDKSFIAQQPLNVAEANICR